jgi:cytoskeletal protein RodZ
MQAKHTEQQPTQAPQQPVYQQQPPGPYPQYPQQQSPMPPQQWNTQQPPIPLPKKKSRKRLWFILAAIVLVLAVIIGVASQGQSQQPASTPQATQQPTTQPTTQAPTQPPAKPTPKPTQVPTQTPAQIEQTYKAGATDTTVANLDKDGNNDQGNIVHFTATIASFVKDDSGNTAGANVTDANYSSFIQIVFPAGTDISQLNKDDTLEVWGQDMGTFSGTNAFGATIQEVGVQAQYMTDQTTGYQAG